MGVEKDVMGFKLRRMTEPQTRRKSSGAGEQGTGKVGFKNIQINCIQCFSKNVNLY